MRPGACAAPVFLPMDGAVTRADTGFFSHPQEDP